MRHETFFDAGKLIVVQSTIVGPRGTTTARMLLDTRATMTTVSPEIIAMLDARRLCRGKGVANRKALLRRGADGTLTCDG
jgi:hypothetical protein